MILNQAIISRYRDMMYSVMKPDTVYYLMTLEYDQFVWPGMLNHAILKCNVADSEGQGQS